MSSLGPVSEAGLSEISRECERVLASNIHVSEEVTVDTNRSAVCARLDSWGKQVSSSVRCRARASTSKGVTQKMGVTAFRASIVDDISVSTSNSQQMPRLQSEVGVDATPSGRSKSKGVGSRFSPAMRTRGRRTGGVPSKSKKRSPALRGYQSKQSKKKAGSSPSTRSKGTDKRKRVKGFCSGFVRW